MFDLDGDWLAWGDQHDVKRAGIEALKAFVKLEDDPVPVFSLSHVASVLCNCA